MRIGKRTWVLLAAAAACSVALVLPLIGGAHIERDPLFVDPAPDTSVFPPAGGDWVRYRPLSDPELRPGLFRRYVRSAWGGTKVTEAEQDGIRRRYARLTPAEQEDARRYVERMRRRTDRGPSSRELGLPERSMAASEEVHVVCRSDSMARLRAGMELADLSARQERSLLRKNERLLEDCRYDEIQEAVSAADNNDIVAIMPGFYTEPTSRQQPHNDPRCADLVEETEAGGIAPSYEYHLRCPNDLSLIAVLGRDAEGACVRCNLQIDGTGARPEDVIIDAAEKPEDPGVKEELFDLEQGAVATAKENVIRADRADGFYVRNLTVQNAFHNGIYGNEMDGMTVNRVNMFWAHEYGHLTFVTDHNIIKNSEAAGSADAGIYPGASPPSRPRINTIVTNNDAHHNALGFSGTMGSNVHIVDNDFHHNSVGISVDSFYRAGHPGFPQNSTVIEGNRIHSNNFDTFSDDSKVKSTVPAAIGTGLWIVGGNDNVVKENWIYDNHRNGTMLITVPDALSNQLSRPPEFPQDAKLSTSHRNRFEGNNLGVSPSGERLPNGVDHWWDELGTDNCWEEPDGMTSDPAHIPDCDDLPNVGLSDPVKEAELAACAFLERDDSNPVCRWYEPPPRPGSGG